MREKVLIIKNRDRSDYQFDTHKLIDLAGADYLTDKDDILVIFFGPITSPKVTLWGAVNITKAINYDNLPGLVQNQMQTFISSLKFK